MNGVVTGLDWPAAAPFFFGLVLLGASYLVWR